ncbi:hypothetical protein CH063_05652 [Colletotrichum higginsianum]|uniref:SnoaL-like domain-containing protein n=2 Tax=Colletotrichum higginsianum TaxID=80884 RepID=H1UZR2_COLHI|nr:hypothetical protein CH63R_08644 [Colletotrichum higginsianum IMI 349063]OBR07123.1 hypothetical protein CH63R_08644 [Colletotrichum higginsianum IMI 349063]TIC92336.1 hypothetical protein CH35J_010125 [Colletotrichum higginsianum]GJC98751.1 hypothetical protein ColKHC_07577 [Colletotrichum higginsianum]CCF33463.1 hypothetical protein CH063_05652 [Colletotrichum higginsianum]
MVNVKEAAQAAITAYGLATQQGGNASVPLAQVASSLASFYLANFTSFTLGGVSVVGGGETAAKGVLQQLRRLNESGLGTDIRLCGGGRVDVVSSQSALCWVTFEMVPPRTSKVGRWTWTNVYGFRVETGRDDGLEGGWEFTNADQEFQTLLERVPDFFKGGTV